GAAGAGAAAGTAAGAAATTTVSAGASLTAKLVLAAIVIGTAGGAIAIRQNAKKTNAPVAATQAAVSIAQPPEGAPAITAMPTGPVTATVTTTATATVTATAATTAIATTTPTTTAPRSSSLPARDPTTTSDSLSTTANAAPPVTAVASGPTTVDAEAALLRNADAALKRGDASGALALVDQHAAQFPNGILAEERDAERVVVLCALGRTDEARAAGAAFLRAHPRSPQASRIRESCAGN
ncbi:MAG: hypothetical protein ACREJX_12410, partial [Polyangiaceae bacterium]